MKRIISLICALALMISLAPLSGVTVRAVDDSSDLAAPYLVGFARVDINPYVVEDDPSSGIMALPLGGTGDTWDRLSTYGLLDDNGDGVVDENDGLKVTCIAISDEDGKTILLITGDFMGVYKTTAIRNEIIERVDAAIASGELSNIQSMDPEQIYYAGTHTHSSPASSAYVSSGKTGTNVNGVDLSVVNENLGIWVNRTVQDVADAAMLALKDRAPAQLTKDQLSVSKATSPVLKDRHLNSTRLYNTEVDGDEFVSGDNFNSVYKHYYADPNDYATSRGINPKQVAEVNDTIYLLKFEFGDSVKLPIILTNWRAHVTTVNRDKVPGSTRFAVSSDYVNAYRHALEYGCEVSFDPVNGYITDWTLGTTQKYRVAFFNDTGGSVNVGGPEKTVYHGSEGDVDQRFNTWLSESVNTTRLKNKTGAYGTVLATLAQECLNDGLNEIAVSNGKIKTSSLNYYAEVKTTGITALAYAAAKACRETAAVKTVTYPYRYTDPATGEVFAVGSSFHADKIIGSWDSKIGAPETGNKKLTLTSFMLSKEVAFLSIPGEPFDFMVKDITVTGDARTAPENNLWNSLIHDDTYGRPFVLGYCNGYQSYFPSYDAYVYNEGSTRWAVGSYEAHQARYEQGTSENMLRLYDQMLVDMAEGSGDLTYIGYCEHCGENQQWQAYNNETSLTTGHYYLLSDVYTDQVYIGGGQTVCIDLKGYSFNGQTRAFLTSKDDYKDVVSIMDSSEGKTGKIQGCGAASGAAVGYYSGTAYIRAGDELNLYSGTLTAYERTAFSAVNGGVLVVDGTFNMYGGAVEGGVVGSFTGSYYSGGIKTGSRTGHGGTIYLTGTLNMYGGTIRGGQLMSITGTVTPTETSYTYQEERVPIEGSGSCIWITKTGTVNLCGDGNIEQLHFADGDGLNVAGLYSGATEIKFDTLTELLDLTVVGTADANADTGSAHITFADAPGKTAAVKGTELVISDFSSRYIPCEACGQSLHQWLPMTDADFEAVGKNGLAPGHYILTEDVMISQQQLNGDGTKPGVFCIDLAGHTFRGSTRAFLVHPGARLNLYDSVGGAYVEGQGSTGLWGGSVYVNKNAEIHLYGGTLRHNTGRTETITNGGAVSINGGLFHLHGGTVEGAKATGKGAAIYVNSASDSKGHFVATGGTVNTGTADVAGPGVYVEKGCFVTVSGDVDIAQMDFADNSANTLTIEGTYTGSMTLKYPDTMILEGLKDIGNAVDADVSHSSITLLNCEGKTAAVRGTDLVISDLPYTYEICETCGECQWIPMTSEDFETIGNDNLTTGHYRLAEDVTVKQLQLNRNDDHPGTFCFDLAGHTILGTTRAFLVYGEARLNIFDTIGTGALEGQGSAAMLGGALYISIDGECHMYGGTVRHNTGRTQTVSGGGAVCARGGAFYLHGGIVEGGKVTGKGAAIQVTVNEGIYGSFTATGGTVTMGTADNFGSCVYVFDGCSVTVGGDVQIAQMSFSGSSAETLTIDGNYSGTMELQYSSSVKQEEGTVIGTVASTGNLSDAVITVSGTSCKRAVVNGENLVIQVVHTYEAVITAPTCTEAGYTTYRCSLCDESYTAEEVSALGHSYEAVVTHPTCAENGFTTYTCHCGDTYCADEVNALGHSYQEKITTAPGCESSGVKTFTCQNCGDVYTQVLDATGHHYQSIVTAPTCTEKGYTTYTCNCGAWYTADEVDALGHSYETVTVYASCTVDGSITDTCSVCGDTLVQVIPAFGHSYQKVTIEATCTVNGSITDTCSTCGDTQIETILATGHSYETVVTAPTCTEQGFTTYICHCGDTYADDYVANTGHDYVTTTVEATCTTDGSITLTCNVCDDVVVGIIPAFGHTFVGGVCKTCHSCEACGDCEWLPMTDADFDALGKNGLKPGHYILTENVTVSQQQLSAGEEGQGTYCVDLAGHTFRGSTRAFLVYTGATLKIFDSVGGGYVEGQGSAALWGGSVRVEANAQIHLYGGTLRHNTGRTETITSGGAVCIDGGHFLLHGGTVEGAKATGKGAAIYVTAGGSFTATGGQVNAGTAEVGGNSVYVEKNCTVDLSGDANIHQIYFVESSANRLIIDGSYSGTVELKYASTVSLNNGAVIGSVTTDESLTQASITLCDEICKRVVCSDKTLVVQEQHTSEAEIIPPSCTEGGYTTYTCTICGAVYTGDYVDELEHSYDSGICTTCGEVDPDYVKPVVQPTLKLKAPALEFKDMIKVIAFFTAENLDSVVEMGMITYTENVEEVDITTANHVIPGAEYDAGTGRYYSSSQGIHAKYLGDDVYLAIYAKLSDGSYVYTRLVSYSPITYATNQLKNSNDMNLKQLVAAMLNYGAAAQNYFGYKTDALANAAMTEEQINLPEAYRADMVNTVASPSKDKQGSFANNKGFGTRRPAVSFEGAFSINYFFTPNYTPVDGITMYYWTEAAFNAVDVLTVENASGSVQMSGEGVGQYRGDIEGIAAKSLSEAVYVAAVYSDGTTSWTSGVLGYSIGAYCSSQATKGGTMADLAMATAVYGYHAKAYFG